MVLSLIRRTMTDNDQILVSMYSLYWLEKIIALAEPQYARVRQIDRGSEIFEEISAINTLFMVFCFYLLCD